METYEPTFDPYRDLKRGEQRKTEYRPGEWQGRYCENSPFVRLGKMSAAIGPLDWINDPHLGRNYFGWGVGFSRLLETPIFKYGSISLDQLQDFRWFMCAALVRGAWIDLCRDLDAKAIEIAPVQVVCADDVRSIDEIYFWDVVRVIDAIDWGRTKATVVKGEIDSRDYVYTTQMGSISLRSDIPRDTHLFRDRIRPDIVFCTRVFEQEAVRRGLKGFSVGELYNNPNSGRAYF